MCCIVCVGLNQMLLYMSILEDQLSRGASDVEDANSDDIEEVPNLKSTTLDLNCECPC